MTPPALQMNTSSRLGIHTVCSAPSYLLFDSKNEWSLIGPENSTREIIWLCDIIQRFFQKILQQSESQCLSCPFMRSLFEKSFDYGQELLREVSTSS